MNEPVYKYIRGQGWVAHTQAQVEILARDDKWAVIRACDVPEGVARTGVLSSYSPTEMLTIDRVFPYTYGPPKDSTYLHPKHLVKVLLESLV